MLLLFWGPKSAELMLIILLNVVVFEFSDQLEAGGFGGGIWILWNQGFMMGFVFNHKQYIYFKVIDLSINWLWVTAV